MELTFSDGSVLLQAGYEDDVASQRLPAALRAGGTAPAGQIRRAAHRGKQLDRELRVGPAHGRRRPPVALRHSPDLHAARRAAQLGVNCTN
ncbi:hypothetical protein [Streptomyces sp. NPDC048411]|uniref:hypothetical protein n=1 Tax=Streptomyces sp. NPDC048411 TaxID=3157206 RepID=UPI003456F54F